MKNIKLIGFLAITAILTVFLTTCENVIGLGEKLILTGPIVTIDSPPARMPVDGKFVMTGTVEAVSNNLVDRLLVTAQYTEPDVSSATGFKNTKFPMEWRYSADLWEVSTDSGNTWTNVPDVELTAGPPMVSADWNGNMKNANWVLPIDMTMIYGLAIDIPVNEYRFTVTAWDTAGNTDTNSSKTRTVVVDTDPPLVSIITPWPYKTTDDPEMTGILGLLDHHSPQYLNKFLNKSFTLQWEIVKELSDIWAVEITFYDYSVTGGFDYISNGDGGLIPNPVQNYTWDSINENNYIYRTSINDVRQFPVVDNPNSINPNYRFAIPDLNGTPFGERDAPDGNGRKEELQNRISTDKTIITVVARCKDMANNELQEKFMGYLVYWPQSDIPWATYPDSIKANPADKDDFNSVVYPSFVLPCRAYDDDGVDRVEYQIYSVNSDNWPARTLLPEYQTPKQVPNPEKTTIQAWDFNPPPTSGVYYIEARIYDIYGIYAIESGYFKVLDISYPEIRPPYTPVASDPMFTKINGTTPDDWNITIEGYATTASGLSSVSIVWINPHSINYAAMSQLSFFRDPEYGSTAMTAPPNLPANTYGWFAPPGPDGAGLDNAYDVNYPNKVWTMKIGTPELVQEPVNDPSGRLLYKYSKTLYLKRDLLIDPNIAADPLSAQNYNFLKSQVFLLKATDVDAVPKSSIITWAPQGDTKAPRVTITAVQLHRQGKPPTDVEDLEPGKYHESLPQFGGGDTITITGEWEEDSAEYFKIKETLEKNFVVTINGTRTDPAKNFVLNIKQQNPTDTSGTWTAVGEILALGMTPEGTINPDTYGTHVLIAEHLKDTLVVSAVITDTGGNISEDGASWLILSDNLRFQRIGSDHSDGIFTNGTPDSTIDIFLEFNKPVTLKNINEDPLTNPYPILILNFPGDTTRPAALAYYNKNHPDHLQNNGASTKQHFTYTVQAGQTIDKLTVTGIYNGDSNYDKDGYPFTWTAPGSNEEIRMVTSNRTLAGAIVNKLPVTTNSADNDYLYTLGAGKQIEIDTTLPTLSDAVSINRQGWYTYGNTIYITLTFSEPVQPDATRLLLNVENDTIEDFTAKTSENVQVSGNSLIFNYVIQKYDYTADYGDIKLLQMEGSIKDLAGNVYNASDLVNRFNGNGIKIDAIVPSPPTIRLTYLQNAGSVITNNKGTGQSGTGVTPPAGDTEPWDPRIYSGSQDFIDKYTGSTIGLKNLYNENLYISIIPSGTEKQDLSKIFYSINYGRDWAPYDYTIANNYETQLDQGFYVITARQIDEAGNVSEWTVPITFNWDMGGLLTLVTSALPNGTYTNNGYIDNDPSKPIGREDVIPVTLTFRNPVIIKEDPVFTLSAVDESNNNTPIVIQAPKPTGPGDPLNPTNSNGAVTAYTFEYKIGPADKTIGSAVLALNNCVFQSTGGPGVTDEDGTDVSFLLNLTLVNSTGSNLQNKKIFYIINGIPELVSGYPKLEADPLLSSSQQTIQEDDSYWTSLKIQFNRNVFKGSETNFISIIQEADGYRLPSVLNLSQRARYRVAIGADLFDQYYKEGTNGYDPNNGPDNSAKYILRFDVDPYNIKPDANGTPLEQLAEKFRVAEGINIPINSSLIDIRGSNPSNGMTSDIVMVRLIGSNGLKVLGANYEVKYGNGFVVDLLGSSCREYDAMHTLDYVSKPTIRIEKSSDVITNNASFNPLAVAPFTQARYIVTPPGTAKIRFDNRTPYSRVTYQEKSDNPGDDSVTWSVNFDKNPPVLNKPTAMTNLEITSVPADQTNVFGSQILAPVTPLERGTAAETTPAARAGVYQGYRWRVRAVGFTGTGTSAQYSSGRYADEIAYRTVIVFATSVHKDNGTTSITGNNGQTFGNGDMFWIRGGNTKTATTIPGFPLTPADNWTDIKNNAEKRTGIRPLSRVSSSPTALADSTWQWVTWDVAAPVYFNLYLGHDNDSEPDILKKYGPKQSAINIGNWTNVIEYYMAFPGERRWLSNNFPQYYSGGDRAIDYTFNSTWDVRPNPEDIN
ncbi:MAG: hypothetical protein FWD78_10490 [Treponema sp.]|nr:hypothetical protein [Treponema sp.]